MDGIVATVVALDTSPATVLRSMRGVIVAARVAYPHVLHVEVRDSHEDVWRLASQDADWSPDAGQLTGLEIVDAGIDEESGELRCRLSSGVMLKITPADADPSATVGAERDPPYWELISPAGIVLEFGPGLRWQISGADASSPARG
jgi:hypothetical protein